MNADLSKQGTESAATDRENAIIRMLKITGLVPDEKQPWRTNAAEDNDEKYTAADLAFQVTKKTKGWIQGLGGGAGLATAGAAVLAVVREQPVPVVVTLIGALAVIITSMIIGLTLVTRQDVVSRTEVILRNLSLRARLAEPVMQVVDQGAEPDESASPAAEADGLEGALRSDFNRLLEDLDKYRENFTRRAKSGPQR